MEILRYFNWVYLLMIGVVVRVVYIGFKTGVVVELFKLLTLCFAIFVTLHYYSNVGGVLRPGLKFLGDILDFMVFGGLWLLVTFIFKLIRDGLMLILRIETHAGIEKWGGLILAVVRSAFVCSLLFLLLSVSGNAHIQQNLKRSFVRPYVSHLALDAYRGFYDGVIIKFFPNEGLNRQAFSLGRIDSDDRK